MQFRQRVVKCAIKYNNNAQAARRYHTSRQQVQRWRNKYDGTVQSLANQSTRPHSHPNQYTKQELTLIQKKHRYHSFEGLAQVYRKLLESVYTRTRLYSPWQNGIVERSNRIDNDLFYSKYRFSSEEKMYAAFKRYQTRTNNISRKILKFKTPNEVVEEYFENAA